VNPAPRAYVFDQYWHLAAERQRIFFSRIRGKEPPWTDDQILANFKFCNAYRASDRVSQYLIGKVIYGNRGRFSSEDELLRIVFFRLFSKIETWEALEERSGPLNLEDFDVETLDGCLEELRSEGRSIYTSAFILCATRAYGFERKHRNHLALLEEMFAKSRLPRQVAAASSLESLYEALVSYPLIGPFMAYQIAIDINYSELTDFSEDEFTVPGPGALRGMRKCFEDFGGLSHQQLIDYMVERQESEFDRLGINFDSLFGRRLHAIDCQNLFCEVDKYSREAFPELKSARSRIKARYVPKRRDLELFYPPKWGLNTEFVGTGAGVEGRRTEERLF
jgi:5-hmdU DNA kinase-like protein